MVGLLSMGLDGLCRSGTDAAVTSSIPASDTLVSISLPVGQGFKARNIDPDVRTIQESLNQITPFRGGPTVKLVVDGKCGPKTNKAIVDFQVKQFGIKGADGLIEPNKQTIQRINQILFSNLPVDPAEQAAIKTKLVSHLGLVRTAIRASAASLLTAIAPTGGFDLGQGAANNRLDRHFALNQLGANARQIAIRNIISVFNIYSAALLMPGALGAGAFEMDPSGDPRIAFTFTNGFFHQGEINEKLKLDEGRIYLGRRAFFALTDGEFCAFIMLHEMAHFVGFPGGSGIVDNGRGWFTDSTISVLNADKRLHNADSYAAYATECRTGSPVKPAYVRAATTSR
ncbi:MAG: peptidoglycan-binding protein [Bryobacteraceae bacterium]